MKKRLLLLLLMLCLLLPLCAGAEVSAFVKDTTEVMTGPGNDYWDPDLYLNHGQYVTAISRAWDDYNGVWQIQVEFTWGVNQHRGYVVARRLYTSVPEIPIEQPLQECYLLCDADAFGGPGLTYTLWNDTVYRGTTATLLAVEDEWGFIECWNGYRQAMWRVWVRLRELSCGQDYLVSAQPEYYSYLPEVPYGGIRAGCGNAKSIMWVQQCLRSCGYGELSVDGKWGPQTTNAVREFRRDYGFGTSENVVTYEVACRMLDVFYQRGMPLSYLRHYLPD